MKKVFLLMLSISLVLALTNCDSNEHKEEENNTPVLSSLSPSSCVSHMPAFTLTANGSKFDPAAKIVFDNKEMETTFVSSTKVACLVGTADCTTDSPMSYGQERNITILVRNPSAAGGDSNTMTFRIDDKHKFTTPVDISKTTNDSLRPDIAVAKNGNLYVVWECKNTGIEQIFFCSSTDMGTSWNTPKNISNTNEYSGSPAIGIDANENLYVVWRAPEGIEFISSTDKGSTWSQPVNLTNTKCYSIYPEIVIDSVGNINLAWYEIIDEYFNTDLRFRRSTDSGKSWGPISRIGPTCCVSGRPGIATDIAGNISVVWNYWNYINNNIYFCRSINGGYTWSEPKQIINYKSITSTSDNFILSIDNEGTIYAFWQVAPENSDILFYSKSEDNGENWTEPVSFINSSSSLGSADIATDGIGNLNIIYYNNGNEVFYCRSINKGVTWCPIQDMYYSGYGGLSIGLDNEGNIYIVWDYNTYSAQIYFTRNSR